MDIIEQREEQFKFIIERLGLLNIYDVYFADGFFVQRMSNDALHDRPCLLVGWNLSFYNVEKYGQTPSHAHFKDAALYAKASSYGCSWWMSTTSDYDYDVVAKIVSFIKMRNQRLWYLHYDTDGMTSFIKKRNEKRRIITNKNIDKIDGLSLKGDVSGLYGKLRTRKRIIQVDWSTMEEECKTQFLLYGEVSSMLFGNISNIYGHISNELTGDISGISGDITNIVGSCTGIKLHIKEQCKEKTNIRTLLINKLSGKFRILSNEESEIAWNAYRRIAHCTLGLTEEERNAIDNPDKVKPPFDVDKWGRKYMEQNGRLFVYSINPCDIAFLKEVGPINTCYCFTSQSLDGRWTSGMRCLMALNCINPNIGCVFEVSKESIRKMNMFKNLKFNWFKPCNGAFFQYDASGKVQFFYEKIDPFDILDQHPLNRKNIKELYGHDGLNVGHTRQKSMAYLEEHMEERQTWAEDVAKEATERIVNNEWDVCFDENWNQVSKSGRVPDEEKVESFKNEAIRVKEILNGIKI